MAGVVAGSEEVSLQPPHPMMVMQQTTSTNGRNGPCIAI
jgi:hypothetical protein